jgi:hypothetical protein
LAIPVLLGNLLDVAETLEEVGVVAIVEGHLLTRTKEKVF